MIMSDERWVLVKDEEEGDFWTTESDESDDE